MSSNAPTQPALARAAEELVRAALVQSEASTLAELKAIHAGTDQVVASIEALAKTLEAQRALMAEQSKLQAEALQAAIKAQTEATEKQTAAIEAQTRLLAYQSAIANLQAFNYFNSRKSDYDCWYAENTQQIVKQILTSFTKGVGCFIDEYACETSGRHDDGKALFREQIVEQVFSMTGHKPRVATSNGKFAIYPK